MHLTSLRTEHFRNLAAQEWHFSPDVNLITGDNGSGKTALLEAIHFLSRGRSFRTAKLKHLIQHEQHFFRLIAALEQPKCLIGLERNTDTMTLRINRQPATSLSECAKRMPVVTLAAHSFALIDAGPTARREFLNFGCFYTEPSFLSAWGRFQKALKNRNAAIRKGLNDDAVCSFDPTLVQCIRLIHDAREHYIDALRTALNQHLEQLKFTESITLRYNAGFTLEDDLLTQFRQQLAGDRRFQHTRYGPHRAELVIETPSGKAVNYLSRGQQKLLVLALHLAQIDVTAQALQHPPLLLIDDLAAEFDATRCDIALTYLRDMNVQLFITAPDASAFDDTDTKHFEISDGRYL